MSSVFMQSVPAGDAMVALFQPPLLRTQSPNAPGTTLAR